MGIRSRLGFMQRTTPGDSGALRPATIPSSIGCSLPLRLEQDQAGGLRLVRSEVHSYDADPLCAAVEHGHRSAVVASVAGCAEAADREMNDNVITVVPCPKCHKIVNAVRLGEVDGILFRCPRCERDSHVDEWNRLFNDERNQPSLP